jgi:hypothetical protein
VKYLDGSFTVPAPGTDEYRRGWERIFGKHDAAKCHVCQVIDEEELEARRKRLAFVADCLDAALDEEKEGGG